MPKTEAQKRAQAKYDAKAKRLELKIFPWDIRKKEYGYDEVAA